MKTLRKRLNDILNKTSMAILLIVDKTEIKAKSIQ